MSRKRHSLHFLTNKSKSSLLTVLVRFCLCTLKLVIRHNKHSDSLLKPHRPALWAFRCAGEGTYSTLLTISTAQHGTKIHVRA
jgi:hypothetical protein